RNVLVIHTKLRVYEVYRGEKFTYWLYYSSRWGIMNIQQYGDVNRDVIKLKSQLNCIDPTSERLSMDTNTIMPEYQTKCNDSKPRRANNLPQGLPGKCGKGLLKGVISGQ
ncbi:hypothetical protein J0S82_010639, partial [Galemys pyrenaicus]